MASLKFCPQSLEELVTNCNQAGYEAGVHIEFQGALSQHSFIIESPEKVISIDCVSQNNVSVKSDMTLPIFFQRSDGTFGDKVCDLSSSLEFTLKSQGDKNVTYEDGKLSLTIPEELKNFPVVNEMQQSKSLFDVIKEIFLQLIEKVFGHTNDIKVTEEDGTITMISSFSKPLKVNSTLKEIKPPINSIETILDK
ncbi:hypothetical protein [Wolbachia endosymbiont (group A) of Volucella inflata]|uniref:hypothetical protein n=1 Tax=Wolbachia endosymbiont (group A) of Volucella inflata TaxID=2954065 RepID=UPI002226275C|nr:hypothetical protein [Wolbachia endosymbiont (group A) of Volucella inflata]